MVGTPESRLITDLTSIQVESMSTPIPDFVAGYHIPAELGYAAHRRLEELIAKPVASDDAAPDVTNDATGQRSGQALGDFVGREKEFTRNLPTIHGNMQAVAEERGVEVAEVWDDVVKILTGSGIGKAMHRTLTTPIEGSSYGLNSYVDENSEGGIAVILRGNIANWSARRQDRLTSFLGGISNKSLDEVGLIVYAGSGRKYSGAGELWRPEFQSHIAGYNDKNEPFSELTEASVAEQFHVPATSRLLAGLGLQDSVEVAVLDVPNKDDGKPANGDDVMRAIGEQYSDRLRNMLVVEVGNAPAGYTQLAGALILAKEFGLDPAQYVATTDSVEIVNPSLFNALSAAEKSKFQNAATALNSFNGWLQQVAKVNEFHLAA